MTELIEKDCLQRDTKFRVRFLQKTSSFFENFRVLNQYCSKAIQSISNLRPFLNSERLSNDSHRGPFYEIWFFSSLIDRNFWSKLLGLKIFRVNACLIWFLRYRAISKLLNPSILGCSWRVSKYRRHHSPNRRGFCLIEPIRVWGWCWRSE